MSVSMHTGITKEFMPEGVLRCQVDIGIEALLWALSPCNQIHSHVFEPQSRQSTFYLSARPLAGLRTHCTVNQATFVKPRIMHSHIASDPAA